MSDEMARGPRRVKVGATLDPELVAAVDRYVEAHGETDRSAVIDDALRLWYARQQDLAMERALLAPRSKRELAEAEDWRRIRHAAAERMIARMERARGR
jgi:metal-responsive CopG/Arc/MetJ family transcriptional regulator